MNNGLLMGVAAAAVVLVGVTIWVIYAMSHAKKKDTKKKKPTIEELDKAYTEIADEDVHHLFNKQFREELRNRGRLRFESVINENAMFLKHDLDLTISQLNDHMKKEISSHLEAEFANYAQAMNDAQNLALDSLRKTAAEVEQQRHILSAALKQEVTEREASLLKVYEDNMAEIVEHYVKGALSEQFDLRTQMPFILEQMEANKQNIIEDMKL